MEGSVDGATGVSILAIFFAAGGCGVMIFSG